MFLKREIQGLNSGFLNRAFKFTCYYPSVFFQLYNMSIKIHLGYWRPKSFGNQKSLCFSCGWKKKPRLFISASEFHASLLPGCIHCSIISKCCFCMDYTAGRNKRNDMSIMVWRPEQCKTLRKFWLLQQGDMQAYSSNCWSSFCPWWILHFILLPLDSRVLWPRCAEACLQLSLAEKCTKTGA